MNNLYEYQENNDKFKSFEDPEKLLRIEKLSSIESQFSHEFSSDEALKKAEGMFLELRDTYGIHVPSIEFIIVNKDRSDPELHIITDRVSGVEINKIDSQFSQKEQAIKDVAQIYSSLLRLVDDKYKNNDFVLWDVAKSSQYIYGKIESEPENHVYLVDTDIKVGHIVDELPMLLDDVVYSVKEIEIKFGMRFDNVRQQITDLLNKISPVDKNKCHTEVIENFLRS